MSLTTHRQLVEDAFRALEPRALVTLDARGSRWVVSLPLGTGQRITVSYPAAPVECLEHAHQFYPRRILRALVMPWARRAKALHARACAHRTELAFLDA